MFVTATPSPRTSGAMQRKNDSNADLDPSTRRNPAHQRVLRATTRSEYGPSTLTHARQKTQHEAHWPEIVHVDGAFEVMEAAV